MDHNAYAVPPTSDSFALNIERLETIAALLPGVTFCFRANSQGRWWLEYVSPSIEEHNGVSQDDAYHDFRLAFEPVHLEDRERFLDSIRQATDTKSNWHCQYRIIHKKTGLEHWINGQAQAHDAGDGTVVFYGALIDITEQRRTEQQLREDAELARLSFAQAPIALFVIDVNTRFRRVNEAFCDLLGRDREFLLQWDWRSLIDQKHRPAAQRLIDILSRTEKEDDELELPLRHSNGEERLVHVRLVKLSQAEGDELLLLGVVQDISDRENREQERMKATKFESLGLLAGGIAHDLNNIIMGISLNLELAGMSADGDEALNTSLQEARTATGRAAELSQRLLTFAKGGDPVLTSVSLAEPLRSTVDFALRGSTLLADYDIAENLAPVMADVHQISQVVENLVINAREACPDGGTLKVIACNVSIAPGEVLNLPPGGYVKIIVSDNGSGIPRENLSRIFDPYFTTKPSGNGIGLATSYSLIKKHKGDITVRSEVNHGTSFCILLPMADTGPAVSLKETASFEVGTGNILIVDDDAMIQHSLQRALTALGFTVSTASDGQEAVELYRHAMAEENPFDVVLLDGTIPGGSGGDVTLQALIEIDPQAKVVYCSGYGDSERDMDWRNKGYAGHLDKPSSIRKICQIITDLTGESGEA